MQSSCHWAVMACLFATACQHDASSSGGTAGSSSAGTAGSTTDAGAGNNYDNPTSMMDTSAAEIALSSVSGSLADADGLTSEIALGPHRSRWSEWTDLSLLAPSTALAAPTACPVLSDAALASCSNGKLDLSYDSCEFARRNRSFANAVWTGGKMLDFGSSCPKRLRDITDLGRTFHDGTTRTTGKISLTLDTSTPSGWDTTISPQPSGGTKVTHTSTDRELSILGIHYVAESSANAATKLWDHTVSTKDPLSVSAADSGGHVVSGTVVVQHNLAKYTAQVELTDVTFDAVSCGCLPVKGSITATLTGSRKGTEKLEITACGAATLTKQNGQTSSVSLTRCL